jgi:glycine dehydrogenase
MLKELENDTAEITGFDAISWQANSGAQDEYAGLRAFHHANVYLQRNVCLIPISAHATNPAFSAMAGMDVFVIKCDNKGNMDIEGLTAKAEKHKDRLSAIMITYPSAFGVLKSVLLKLARLFTKRVVKYIWLVLI